jgi:hypothetical protein
VGKLIEYMIRTLQPLERGNTIPTFLHGHCAYPIDENDHCRAPAVRHLYLDDDGARTFTCRRHEPIIIANFHPPDWHDIGPDCIAAHSAWCSTGIPGDSFCTTSHHDAAAAVEERELIGAAS